VPPGLYSSPDGTAGADCTQPGLYSFWLPWGPGNGGVFRIVPGPPDDPTSVYAAASYLTAVGGLTPYPDNHFGDDLLSVDDMKAQMAAGRQVAILCGTTVRLVRSILDDAAVALGSPGCYQHRQVHLLTAYDPNGWLEGHVTMEMKVKGQWCFADPNGHNSVRSWQQGTFVPMDVADTFEASCLAQTRPPGGGISGFDLPFATKDYSYLAYPEGHPPAAGGFSALALRLQMPWANFVDLLYQIPGIYDESGNVYSYLPPWAESRRQWVEGPTVAYVAWPAGDWNGWCAKFYS
jgi:hypothetical protein